MCHECKYHPARYPSRDGVFWYRGTWPLSQGLWHGKNVVHAWRIVEIATGQPCQHTDAHALSACAGRRPLKYAYYETWSEGKSKVGTEFCSVRSKNIRNLHLEWGKWRCTETTHHGNSGSALKIPKIAANVPRRRQPGGDGLRYICVTVNFPGGLVVCTYIVITGFNHASSKGLVLRVSYAWVGWQGVSVRKAGEKSIA